MKLRRAFTLVELLVVIGVIAILIGILLPTLNAARNRAENIQCLSNLRACGQILHIYAQQNRGYFPQMSLQSPETLVTGNKIGTDPPAGVDLYYSNVREALARITNPKSDPTACTETASAAIEVRYWVPARWPFTRNCDPSAK